MTSSPLLEQLAADIGGEIKSDGELYYGPPESQIFITAQDDGSFFLASQHQLYAIKNGKARRVRAATKGEDAGWYYASASAEQIRAALDLALGNSEKEHTIEFAYESILRDHCAHNLSAIEPGLSLYNTDGLSGIEFPAGGRFIDILAVDSASGLVVFEFKLSRGHDRVVGQLLRYVGWVRQNLAKPGQRVRGIIVARLITEDLRLATIGQADIRLMEYDLSITFKQAPPLTTKTAGPILNGPQAATSKANTADLEAIFKRLTKLKPTKRTAAVNSIKAMFQLTDPIDDAKANDILESLRGAKFLTIDANDKIHLRKI